ncbi:DUF397 domain-containing protein [Frankia tisae]|uniref:DUF397 domain-containing protein n=1 Tax=Frankia tisae TaxID=2950104 RepID=UPI0021BFFFCC|nr:DUF397 domain-containing protein [Frankia tisae]
MNLSGAEWRKSSHSATQTNCVEIARVGDVVAVRDSKDPDGPVLVFTPSEWAAFLAGARDGEFNL